MMLLVAVLCTSSAGGTAVRPRADRPSTATAPAACPADPGIPIAGLGRTVLPCLTDPGRAVAAAAVHGRAELINMWASWCAPCRREASLLEAAHRAAGDRVLFLGVDSRDDRENALRFLAASGVTYPQVFDASATFALRVGTAGMPYTLAVDASGRIAYRHMGQLTPQALRAALISIGVAVP